VSREHTIARLATLEYLNTDGGSMAGNVVFRKDNQKGCKEFVDSGISFKSKPCALPTIVLLDRGSMIHKPSFFYLFWCSFY
jgi:hypothetical protein